MTADTLGSSKLDITTPLSIATPVRAQHCPGLDNERLPSVQSPPPPPPQYQRVMSDPTTLDDDLAGLFLDILEQDVVTPSPPEDLINRVLPDELLSAIFGLAGSRSAQLLPLSLVCRRWQRVSEPLLYRKLDLGCTLTHMLAIYKRIAQKPVLADYVREIHASGWKSIVAGYYNYSISQLLEVCKATRVLALCIDSTKDVSSLVGAIRELSHLKKLNLSGDHRGKILGILFDGSSRFHLSHLRLSRFDIAEGSSLLFGALSRSATESESHHLISSDQYYTGSLTSVELGEPLGTPEMIERFLSESKALENLSLVGLKSSPNHWDSHAVDHLLQLHSRSLKRVELGCIWHEACSLPDFSQFHSLAVLAVSAYNLCEDSAHEAARKMSAPCLCELQVSFGMEDHNIESAYQFGRARFQWLETFASTMSSKYPTSKLKNIYAKFNPHSYPFLPRSATITMAADQPIATWPWFYVEKAVQSCAQYGICLDYSKKPFMYISEAEWVRTHTEMGRMSDPRWKAARANNMARKVRRVANRAEREAASNGAVANGVMMKWLRQAKSG